MARYNGFVDSGTDEDFGKADATVQDSNAAVLRRLGDAGPHDTRVGLRINAKCEVVDLQGQVIPGLYCGGESAGGFSQHGLARCLRRAASPA